MSKDTKVEALTEAQAAAELERLAAEILRPAQKKFDDNPDLAFALAEALMSSY